MRHPNQTGVLSVLLTIAFFMILMTITATAKGAEVISPGDYTILAKDQAAPFEGLLFKQASVAVILAKIIGERQKCEKTIKFEKDKCVLDLERTSKECAVNLKASETRYKEVIRIKDIEIAELVGTRTYKYKFWDKPLWVGVAVGVVTSMAIGFGAYSLVNR